MAKINTPEKPLSDSSEFDSETEPDNLTSLLEPYTKHQLIDLISAAAVKSSSLSTHIRDVADRDMSHRTIFVHGLGWDTTAESLIEAFESCGKIETCRLMTDKVTGKSKGFAFIEFKTRKSAMKALKTPQRKINNRMISCRLASLEPPAVTAKDRKIYVSNVPRYVDKGMLRAFFESFGDIQTGPVGFDTNTGQFSRGFAIFVYMTVEGAKKALEEPYKMFQGHQLHCQKAAVSGKNKANSSGDNQAQVLAAMAAAQNSMLFGQYLGLNSVYGAFSANSGFMNPMAAGALDQSVLLTSQVNVGAISGSSVLAAYRNGTCEGLQQVYRNAQGSSQGTGGSSFPGHTSYMCMVLVLLLLLALVLLVKDPVLFVKLEPVLVVVLMVLVLVGGRQSSHSPRIPPSLLWRKKQ